MVRCSEQRDDNVNTSGALHDAIGQSKVLGCGWGDGAEGGGTPMIYHQLSATQLAGNHATALKDTAMWVEGRRLGSHMSRTALQPRGS